MYKRILLKLSGEQLAGEYDGGFDTKRAVWIAEEIKKATSLGVQVVVMVGGGNYARGAQLVGNGIERVTADAVGMLATVMNGIALADVFNNTGLPSRILTNIKVDQIADQFTHRRALSHLHKGRVVVVSGGIGRPYLTTDTAAVSLALELDCDAIMKSTKVDGVFDKDPEKYEDAQKLTTVTLQDAIEDDAIKVMDKAALALAQDYKKSVVIFKLLEEDAIKSVVEGGNRGTTLS